MALIKCSECGQMVSDKASVCPKCGNPINVAPTGGYQQPSDKKSNTWLYVLTGVLGVIAIIVAFSVLSTSTCQGPKTSAPVAPAPADTVSTPPTQAPAQAQPSNDDAATQAEPKAEEAAPEKPSGRTMYFIVVSSMTTLSGAKQKANEVGGFVVKGYSDGAMRYRVCVGRYNSRDEAKDDIGWAKDNYAPNAWILKDKEGAIVD